MKYFLAAVLALLIVAYLAGCATCQKHPVACAVGAGVIAGSIAASANHTAPADRHISTPGVDCSGGACQ